MHCVLVVDDDESIRRLVSEVIKAKRHQIVGEEDDIEIFKASNAEEAFQIILHNPIDLVITDISMPEATGWDLIDHVMDEIVRPPRFIAISGVYASDIRIEAAKRNVVWLTKPFEIEALVGLIKVVLFPTNKTLVNAMSDMKKTFEKFSDSVIRTMKDPHENKG